MLSFESENCVRFLLYLDAMKKYNNCCLFHVDCAEDSLIFHDKGKDNEFKYVHYLFHKKLSTLHQRYLHCRQRSQSNILVSKTWNKIISEYVENLKMRNNRTERLTLIKNITKEWIFISSNKKKTNFFFLFIWNYS